MIIEKDGREIELSVRMYDHDDIQVTEAYYTDTDEPVPDDIIEEIEEQYASKLYEEAYENAVMAAEYSFEGDR